MARKMLVLAIALVFFLSAFAFVVPVAAAPATATEKAASPEAESINIPFEGYTSWAGREVTTVTFDVPAGYETPAEISGQYKEGHPENGCTPVDDPNDFEHRSCDQNQPNEEICIFLNGQQVSCTSDQSPLDDQWFHFGIWSANVTKGSNTLRIEHSGQDGSFGSTNFEGTLVVQPLSPPPQPPVCKFVADPDKGEAPLPVTFDGSGSSDPDGKIERWYWDYGDGNMGKGETVNHTYTEAGTFTATLEVTDDSGLTDKCSKTISVSEPPPLPKPPVCAFDAEPASGEAPLPVTFDGSGSSDPDGKIERWYWDYGDGNMGKGETVNHTYTEAGTFTATLEVTDDSGLTDKCSKTISVSEPPPPPPVPVEDNPLSPCNIFTTPGTVNTDDFTVTVLGSRPSCVLSLETNGGKYRMTFGRAISVKYYGEYDFKGKTVFTWQLTFDVSSLLPEHAGDFTKIRLMKDKSFLATGLTLPVRITRGVMNGG